MCRPEVSRAPKWHAEQMAAQQGIACPELLARLTSHYIISSDVPHYIILKEMEYYGFQTHTIEWFKSYILNRQQQLVSSHNELSSAIETSVHQGPVLGPILFIV